MKEKLVDMDTLTKKIQSVAYDILLNFDEVCRKHNLKYYLAYGSLLGGVRHQGFIPWDDDLDVWMPRDDYTKLCRIMSEKNDNRYDLIVNCEIGDLPLSFQGKFVNTSLMCDRDKFGEIVKAHPWIDIFVLDSFPSQKQRTYVKRVKFNSVLYNLSRLRNINGAKENSTGIRRVLFKLNDVFHFLDIIGESRIEKAFLKQLTKYNSGDLFFCFATVYMNNLKKCVFNADWFGNPHYGTFEDRQFPFPSNYKAVLESIYNDYMTPPPEDKRVRAHDIQNITEIE